MDFNLTYAASRNSPELGRAGTGFVVLEFRNGHYEAVANYQIVFRVQFLVGAGKTKLIVSKRNGRRVGRGQRNVAQGCAARKRLALRRRGSEDCRSFVAVLIDNGKGSSD